MEKIRRLNPLLEVLVTSPRRVNKIFIQRERYQKKISEIIHLARAQEIPCSFVPKKKLDEMAPGHQGVVAELTAREFSSLEEILEAAPLPFLVLLDGVEDPQNLGAIIRTAAGAGVDGVIIPERRSAPLSEAVSRVSAGAVEHCRIARVRNLARVMEELRRKGVWLVGTEGGTDNMWYEFDYTLPLALVFGSEGKGLRPLIRKKCDKLLSLPLKRGVSSLNVASAASIFIFEVLKQRKVPKK
ncbi:MAG: 23S rRNA (guanosine(2251)-2'-O)-methyltransferase RlmB [Candidatus Aminicenantales bacterium]